MWGLGTSLQFLTMWTFVITTSGPMKQRLPTLTRLLLSIMQTECNTECAGVTTESVTQLESTMLSQSGH